MRVKRFVRPTVALAIVIWAPLAIESRAADKMMLDHTVIVTDSAQPSFVQYGVQDLAGYLGELTGREVPILAAPDGTKHVEVLVGEKAVRRALSAMPVDEKLGEEGYVLKSVCNDGRQYVVAVGATPRGTKAALEALMKTIQLEGKSPFVPASLNVSSRPAFAKRGMHFNGWRFTYPYTFRNWREKDWQSYLDILSYQGVNLLYVWPFIEIMPVPLSAEDRAYLEECRRVVDYAQKNHGMEVWIMQCTNRVAKDRCGVADPRLRPYWRPTQQDLNPGDPDQFQAIMASREAMYRIINNADGVCNIDSDPGAAPPGSTLNDYVKVLQGCRALLDRYNTHGKQTKLVNWIYAGWAVPANADPVEHQRRTIQNLKEGLPEPWWLICGMDKYLPMCRQEGVLAKTVLLPYDEVEFEPSYPTTNVQIDKLRALFETRIMKYPELAGVMGNTQTPLLQFPNIYFFTSLTWDLEYRKRTEKEVLLDLAGYLYPQQRELLADAYLAMKEPDAAKIKAIVERLDGLVRQDRLGQPGVFGRKLFPDHRIVAESLVPQLRLRAARERLIAGILPATPERKCEELLCDYLDAYLAWDSAHGWHKLWGWHDWPLGARTLAAVDPRFRAVGERLRQSLGGKSGVDACLHHVAQALSAKYDSKAVEEGCIVRLHEVWQCK